MRRPVLATAGADGGLHLPGHCVGDDFLLIRFSGLAVHFHPSTHRCSSELALYRPSEDGLSAPQGSRSKRVGGWVAEIRPVRTRPPRLPQKSHCLSLR